MLQAGGLAWVVGAAGFAAGVLLIVSEFTAIRYVKVITATCADLTKTEPAQIRDDCLVMGHESHLWAFALLGLFIILMTFGAAAGGSRPAAIALLVAGAAGLAITLLHDLPDTSKTGAVGIPFANAKAYKGTGFWLELVGSSLALACGAFATWRTPPPRRGRRLQRAAAGKGWADTGEAPPEAGEAPPEAGEPASA